MVQRRLALLTTDTIQKQQFGRRNSFSTADVLAKLISYTETAQNRDCVISVLGIGIKGAFDNMHRNVLLKTMSGHGSSKVFQVLAKPFSDPMSPPDH